MVEYSNSEDGWKITFFCCQATGDLKKSCTTLIRLSCTNKPQILINSALECSWRNASCTFFLKINKMSTENNIVTFFNKRYPNGRYSETAPAYFNVEKDRYDRFSLDIGWAMRSMHSNRRMRGMAGGNCRRYKKTCNGFIVCKDENCSFFMFQRRPGITEAAVKNQINAGCPGCSGTMYHDRTCRAHAFFLFRRQCLYTCSLWRT